jgi:hypothetical protein
LSDVCRDRERKRPGNRQFHATPPVVPRNNRRFAQLQCDVSHVREDSAITGRLRLGGPVPKSGLTRKRLRQ